MTVAELTEHLKTQPQNMLIAYDMFGEHYLMDISEIRVLEACEPRPDGLILDRRPDKPTRKYLCFPGN